MDNMDNINNTEIPPYFPIPGESKDLLEVNEII